MNTSLIVAYDENNVIGYNNELPWFIPEDLKWFKEVTLDSTVCMGLNTWLSLPEKVRPLPGRENIVISSSTTIDIDGVKQFNNHIDALLYCQLHDKDVYIMGGERMYAECLPYINKLYITHVKGKHDGDTYFPKINLKKDWYRISRTRYETHESCIYIRRRKVIKL